MDALTRVGRSTSRCFAARDGMMAIAPSAVAVIRSFVVTFVAQQNWRDRDGTDGATRN